MAGLLYSTSFISVYKIHLQLNVAATHPSPFISHSTVEELAPSAGMEEVIKRNLLFSIQSR